MVVTAVTNHLTLEVLAISLQAAMAEISSAQEEAVAAEVDLAAMAIATTPHLAVMAETITTTLAGTDSRPQVGD